MYSIRKFIVRDTSYKHGRTKGKKVVKLINIEDHRNTNIYSLNKYLYVASIKSLQC